MSHGFFGRSSVTPSLQSSNGALSKCCWKIPVCVRFTQKGYCGAPIPFSAGARHPSSGSPTSRGWDEGGVLLSVAGATGGVELPARRRGTSTIRLLISAVHISRPKRSATQGRAYGSFGSEMSVHREPWSKAKIAIKVLMSFRLRADRPSRLL
jgi:hypothetical protein